MAAFTRYSASSKINPWGRRSWSNPCALSPTHAQGRLRSQTIDALGLNRRNSVKSLKNAEMRQAPPPPPHRRPSSRRARKRPLLVAIRPRQQPWWCAKAGGSMNPILAATDRDAATSVGGGTGTFQHASVSSLSTQQGWLGTPDRLRSNPDVLPVLFAGTCHWIGVVACLHR